MTKKHIFENFFLTPLGLSGKFTVFSLFPKHEQKVCLEWSNMFANSLLHRPRRGWNRQLVFCQWHNQHSGDWRGCSWWLSPTTWMHVTAAVGPFECLAATAKEGSWPYGWTESLSSVWTAKHRTTLLYSAKPRDHTYGITSDILNGMILHMS